MTVRTLRATLARTIAGSMILMILILTSAVFVLMIHEFARVQDIALQQASTRTVRLVQANADWTASGYCEVIGSPACSRVVTAGEPVDPSTKDLPVTARTLRVAAGKQAAYFADVTVRGAGVRMLVTPISDHRAVLTGTPTRPQDEAVTRLALVLAGFGALAIAVVVLTAFLSVRRGLRPLSQLAATASAVAVTGDPAHRVEIGGHEELRSLAETMNAMLQKLETSQIAQRQLVADASHELRTPLTSLQTNLTLLERDDLDRATRTKLQASVRREIVGMTALVEDLTSLARGESMITAMEFGFVALLEHAIASARRHWPDRRFHCEIADRGAVPQPVVVQGDEALIARLIANVLDNAAKFGVTGDDILTTLTVEGPELVLSVRDCGPGFAANELDLVFERFYRSPVARGLPGSGLGLAIARQIATTHGGTVIAENTPPGATVTLRLPRAPDPS